MSTEPLVVGAVAYTPNVVPIWEGIRGYFQDSESPDTQMDFVLYSNYARLVDSLIAGHIDIAWNTNLAYVRTVLQTGGRCTPLAQRDTDVDYTTVFVAHAGSDLHGAKDIAGKRLALGSADSAHAAILPLYYLRRAGIAESDLQVIRFDTTSASTATPVAANSTRWMRCSPVRPTWRRSAAPRGPRWAPRS